MKTQEVGLISIAIPTRNRGNILGEAIQCCLNQEYTNIEVVVADNSDTDALERPATELRDSRVKVVRTGNLAMADNWQVALENCSGEFLYIIADKILLHKEAISTLAKGISQYNFEAYSFLHSANKEGLSAAGNIWEAYQTKPLIESARKGDINGYLNLGFRGYSLAISRTLFRTIKEKHTRVSWPVSPDFTMAFLSSFYCQSFGYIPWCPFKYNHGYASNGFSSMYGGGLAREFLRQYKMTEDEAIEYAPIKVYTVWNSVLSDFYRVCKMVGLKCEASDIDIVGCWKNLYSEIMHHHLLTHIDASEKLKIMFELIETTPELQNQAIMNHIDRYAIVPPPPAGTLNKKASILKRLLRKALRF